MSTVLVLCIVAMCVMDFSVTGKRIFQLLNSQKKATCNFYLQHLYIFQQEGNENRQTNQVQDVTLLSRRVERKYVMERRVMRQKSGEQGRITCFRSEIQWFFKKIISKFIRESELIELSTTCFRLAKLRLSEDNSADSQD